jgi:predicted DNA-binding transcriptional regulator AlpA
MTDQLLLTREDLAELGIDYSPQHLWRLIRDEKFPQPVKPSRHGRCFWRRADIMRWIDRPTAEPKSLP